jgi:hypothetical protein
MIVRRWPQSDFRHTLEVFPVGIRWAYQITGLRALRTLLAMP